MGRAESRTADLGGEVRLTLRLKKCKSDELFFFLAYGLFLTFTVLSTSLYYRIFHGRPFQVMYVVCVALLFLQQLQYVRYSIREFVGVILAFCLFAIAFLVASGALQRSIPCIFLFCFCGRRIPFRKIAGFALWVTFFLVSFVMISGYCGLIVNHTVVISGRVREYLGFRYALFPSAHLLNMTALWVYLHKDKVPLTGAAILALANCWMYSKTDSRMSFAFAICILLAGVVLCRFPQILDKLHLVRWAMVISFPLCAAVSMYLTITYNPTIPWMAKLNRMLSGRLRLGLDSLQLHGAPLFGQTIDWVGNGLDAFGEVSEGVYDYVDCLYVRLLQNYGPIFLVLFLFLITWAMVLANRKRDYLLLVIMATVAAHCMLDDLSLYLYYNTFWFAMGSLLLNPAAAGGTAKTEKGRRIRLVSGLSCRKRIGEKHE